MIFAESRRISKFLEHGRPFDCAQSKLSPRLHGMGGDTSSIKAERRHKVGPCVSLN